VRVGPASFNGFNDGDAALVRAIWCLVCHLSPSQIVETGVAHGFTSRFILEALEQNGAGHLSSIDLPPLDSTMQRQIGMAVEPHLRPRWSLTLGSSRRCLATLLEALGAIDIFVHDSLHSERNVRFELDLAWRYLRPGGALVVDDVDSNWGFKSFLDAHPLGRAIVAEAEPVRPDFRRFNNKGLFGIVLKPNVQATVR
jgi:cephalosporin hydroxylase